MGRQRSNLTYSNVMVTILAFVVLSGGAAYAASHLGKNSVGPKQLKKNSVTTAKIKKEAVTAAKVKKGTLTGKQINASTLGTVPTAQTANTLTALEAVHVVGAAGEPPFAPGASSMPAFAPGINLPPVGFYKDHEGIVHLEGAAEIDRRRKIYLHPSTRVPAPERCHADLLRRRRDRLRRRIEREQRRERHLR